MFHFQFMFWEEITKWLHLYFTEQWHVSRLSFSSFSRSVRPHVTTVSSEQVLLAYRWATSSSEVVGTIWFSNATFPQGGSIKCSRDTGTSFRSTNVTRGKLTKSSTWDTTGTLWSVMIRTYWWPSTVKSFFRQLTLWSGESFFHTLSTTWDLEELDEISSENTKNKCRNFK